MNATAAIIYSALDDVMTDALVTNQHAEKLANELAAALEARGYIIKAKPAPRKPAAPVEIFAPNTGNAELDAFMNRHHNRDWEARLKKALTRTRPGMLAMPARAPGHPRKTMTQAERAELYSTYQVRQHSA